LKVVVVTTSYPRHAEDVRGLFVSDAVERIRARGVEVDVVAPGVFRDFGLASGAGVKSNLRRRPWALPGLLGSMAAATRRAARNADLVHAHWLPCGAVAAASGKPFVVTLHGTDMAIAAKARPLARAVLRRAAGVIAVSEALATEARALGRADVCVVPNGVVIPDDPGKEAEPAEILYAGRLSPEKGVEELAEAAAGLPLVFVGDGPLRARIPSALGFLSRAELHERYRRAAVVACPSRREGFGVVCAEAMAYARPVVATAVGGLADLVRHEETGLLVQPGDPCALRAALERLLDDPELRRRLGAAGRARVSELCDWDTVTDATLAVYRDALR
jgi:glycosyltransferase involved in cell wall biosynthesis